MKLNNIQINFEIGETIWLKTNPDAKGVITGIIIRPNAAISYFVSWNSFEEIIHYEFELTSEKPVEFEE